MMYRTFTTDHFWYSNAQFYAKVVDDIGPDTDETGLKFEELHNFPLIDGLNVEELIKKPGWVILKNPRTGNSRVFIFLGRQWGASGRIYYRFINENPANPPKFKMLTVFFVDMKK